MTATDPRSGTELMLAYQGGDEGAFDRIVERYSAMLYSLFTRFLGARAGREDLVQEVFLRLIKGRERYRPSARFTTYLYRIAFNLATNERARTSLRAADALEGDGRPDRELEDEAVPAPESRLERDDVVDTVQRAIAALPDQQRMAIVLARYEEMAYAEIAQVLDSTEKAVKSLVHRARENLRAALAPLLQEETA